MTVRTSAKSRLIRPGIVIRSQMPWTPWRSTSSAILKASSIDVDRSSTSSRRSFGITITVSHAARSSSTPCVRGRLAARALEPERRRDDADRQRAELARDPRDDRCGAGARAATLAGGDEHHVRAAERVLDLVVALLRSAAADVRLGARAEALGELAADVDLDRRIRELELLHVGVDRDELDLRDPRVDHPVDGVEAARRRRRRRGSRRGTTTSRAGPRTRAAVPARAAARSHGRRAPRRRTRAEVARLPEQVRRQRTSSASGSRAAGQALRGPAQVRPRAAPPGRSRNVLDRSLLRLLGRAAAPGASVAADPSGCCSCCRWAASVARKSSASGPSRMLARFRAIEHLLRQLPVRLSGRTRRIVFQHG